MAKITATVTTDHGNHISGVKLVVSDLLAITGGTPKQTDWAAKIRDGALVQIGEAMSIRAASFNSTPAADVSKIAASLQAAVDRLVAKLDTLTNATWWIDNRDALTVTTAAATIAAAKI